MPALLVALFAATALAACGSSDDGATATDGGEAKISGEFAAVPDAAAEYSEVSGEADIERADGGTTVSLAVSGLQPETAYIAHLHSGGCNLADPGGPHFQFEEGGSDQPPNEIHLQFTSDEAGEGEAEASSKKEVPAGEAGSVVIHLDDSEHGMSSAGPDPGEAEAVFVHEGVDHSKEGSGHSKGEGDHMEDGDQMEGEHAHSDKIACAELEGASASAEEGESTASGEVPTIVVRDGEPVGGIEKLEYSAGEQVRFRVESDAAEEIHVHGYDISKEVAAGGTVEFDFPADLEGIYEAELEGLGVQIAELQVNP